VVERHRESIKKKKEGGVPLTKNADSDEQGERPQLPQKNGKNQETTHKCLQKKVHQKKEYQTLTAQRGKLLEV